MDDCKGDFAKFSDEDMHLQSGRVIWREVPVTRGCYEYLDNGDCEKVVKGAETENLAKGQEEEASKEKEEDWEKLFSSHISNYMLEDVANFGTDSGAVKGHDKGNSG